MINPDRSSRPDILEALADEVRAALLWELCEYPDHRCDIEEVTDTLADRLPREGGRHAPDRINTSLYHHHLPKLEHLGFIEYDWDGGRISYTGDPSPDKLQEIIEEYGESL